MTNRIYAGQFSMSMKVPPILAVTICLVVCAGAFADTARDRFEDGTCLSAISDRADEMIARNEAEQAVQYLEEKTAAYSAWKKEHPQESVVADELLPLLYFRMAYAKSMCGRPTEEIISAYKEVLSRPSLMLPFEQIASLAWLQGKIPAKEYGRIVRPIVNRSQSHDLAILLKVLDVIAAGGSPGQVSIYKQYFDGVVEGADDPAVFFQAVENYLLRNLGDESKQKERKQIADDLLAYSRSQPRLAAYVLERDLATVGELMRQGKSTNALKICDDFLQHRMAMGKDVAEKIRICSAFNSLASSFAGQDSLTEAIKIYNEVDRRCGTDPNMAEVRKNALGGLGAVAEQYAGKKDYKRAVEIYRDLVTRYERDEERVSLEMRICQCLNDGQNYEGAIAEIDRLVGHARKTGHTLRRTLVPQMILMKSQSLIQMGQVEAASNLLLSLITEYPEIAQVSDAAFLIGQCRILRERFTEVADGFNFVLKEDPNRVDVRKNALSSVGAVAEKYVERKNYRQAVEIYRGLTTIPKEDQEQVPLEMRICQCLKDGEDYEGEIAEIGLFVEKARKPGHTLRRTLVPQMILMKGHGLIQLGQIEAASDLFLSFITEYPEVAQAPDAAFFVGYCRMLQGNFAEAKDGFNVVLKEYPNCGYVGKAKEFLDRIQRMTE